MLNGRLGQANETRDHTQERSGDESSGGTCGQRFDEEIRPGGFRGLDPGLSLAGDGASGSRRVGRVRSRPSRGIPAAHNARPVIGTQRHRGDRGQDRRWKVRFARWAMSFTGSVRPPRRLGAGTGRIAATARRHLGRNGGWAGRALLLIALIGLLAVWPSPVAAQEDDGAQIYQQACASCHQADGRGIEGTFPPLVANPNAADAAYVAEVIKIGREGPLEVGGVAYDGVMTPVAGLTDAQVEAVTAYVVTLAGVEKPDTTPTTTRPDTGDVASGESLFVGRVSLSAGGGACGSCHTAGGVGGGSLGPDLTDVVSRLGGQTGLSAWLASSPTPTMQALFGDHPLTEAEITDLVSFLQSAEGTEPSSGPDVMLLGGTIGFAALLGVMALFFRRPKGRYVDQLRSNS